MKVAGLQGVRQLPFIDRVAGSVELRDHLHRQVPRLGPSGNYQIGLGIMFAFAVVGLIGAMTIRETNCHYITVPQN